MNSFSILLNFISIILHFNLNKILYFKKDQLSMTSTYNPYTYINLIILMCLRIHYHMYMQNFLRII